MFGLKMTFARLFGQSPHCKLCSLMVSERRPERLSTRLLCVSFWSKVHASQDSYTKDFDYTEDCKGFLGRVATFQDSALSNEDSINLLLLKKELELFLSGCEVKGYYLAIGYADNLKFPFERVVDRMNYNNENDYQKLLSRFKYFPQQVDDVISILRQGINEGITQHQITMELIIKDIGIILEVAPQDTKFYKPFQKIHDLSCISPERKEELCQLGIQEIRDKLQGSYKTLITFLKDEYQPNTRQEIGCGLLPNGKVYYEEALKFHITCDLTPKEVFDIGLSEVNRIRNNMDKLMKSVHFKGDLKAFFEHLKNEKRFYFQEREELIQGHRDILDKVKNVLPKYFKNIPDLELSLEPVWMGTECEYLPAGFYFAPSNDGGKPGTFYLNCHKPETRPKYEMMSLSLHEALPGHHMQTSYSLSLTHLPGYRRFKDDRYFNIVPSTFPMHSGYIEGWGMYCEYLGEEMGLYEDVYSLFGSYCTGLQRACRSVIDPALNVLEWTKEQAVQFLENNTPMAPLIIEQEFLRCISVPGQACSYTIGQLKIKELRQKSQDKLGEKFDIKDFHDVVLSCGPVPLTVLEILIDKYIDNTLQS